MRLAEYRPPLKRESRATHEGIQSILSGLNNAQRRAAEFDGAHALVLAGAGCGKTKTIEARIKHLISMGVRPHEIAVLTFTNRAAEEIFSRVEHSLGGRARGIQASTMHALCIKQIRRFPNEFGCEGFSVIDRDDQLDIFKALLGKRGKEAKEHLPTAAQLADIYSFGRNTRCLPTPAIENEDVALLRSKDHIIAICREYKAHKQRRRYLDYDDILEIVGNRLNENQNVRRAVCKQFKHVLVDEFQDTNPLQWHLLAPFLEYSSLFCVGDDAQSIYGFRGADFKNVHRFEELVHDATILRLNENYRSTQEILDVSNWLLEQSSIDYNKRLIAARGAGCKPRLLNFPDDWCEARWIASDIAYRQQMGSAWRDHMVLVRTAFSARPIEACLVELGIPYVFIGGAKLLETAHVKDLMAALRIVANPQDEIAWMRFLRLWPGIGQAKAASIVGRALGTLSLDAALRVVGGSCPNAHGVLRALIGMRDDPAGAVRVAVERLSRVLEANFKKDWALRQQDFFLVEKLAQKSSSVSTFIENYLLDPLGVSEVRRGSGEDTVSLITVHSGKGSERKVCYVANVSLGAFPSTRAASHADRIEEERRVLYVALTRSQDELIITRKQHASNFGAASSNGYRGVATEAYFLKNIPKHLVDEEFL